MEIRLEPEQLELLRTLSEAQRSTPREERRKVLVARTLQADLLVHPGIPEDRARIYFGDLEVLERYGLVYITYPGRDPNVDVTPEGYAFLENQDETPPTEELSKNQEQLAQELLAVLEAIRDSGFQDEELMQRAKVLNAHLAPTYTAVYGAVPLISTDYPPRVWWTRAHEQASQALAAASAGWKINEQGAGEKQPVQHSRNLFIVHGREHGLKEAVARLVERLGYVPIILHEKANRGRTIIEKFEQEADATFAIILLTPDDEGRLRGEDSATELSPRARQNVVWEFGYFTGALGRGRVVALLADSDMERPSDIQGVLYIPVSSVEDTAWRLNLAREMRAAGLEVDLNRLME